MAIEVKVKHDKTLGAYLFTFKFHKTDYNRITAMAELIRTFVPSSSRDYDAVTCEWTVLDNYWPPIKELLDRGSFHIVEEQVISPEDFFYNQGVASSVPISKESLANQLLAMLGITAEELADSNRAKKAYRRKAMELHPDRNSGDGSRMSELNSIWSAYNAN